jgi:cytochrome b involved in lipid metabolism
VLLKPKTAHLTHHVQQKESDEDEPDSPKFGAVSLEETKTQVSKDDATPTFIGISKHVADQQSTRMYVNAKGQVITIVPRVKPDG